MMTHSALSVCVDDPVARPPFAADQYHSVEFQPKNLGAFYYSKIWDLSPDGLCVLVKSSSRVLSHLNVGDTLAMKYHPVDRRCPDTMMPTRIRHMTLEAAGKFRGHVRVGLTPVGG